MQTLARNSVVVLSTALAFITVVAQADVGPDNSVSGTPGYSTNRGAICLGDSCPPWNYSFAGAFQNSDCNQAGPGNQSLFVLSPEALVAGVRFWNRLPNPNGGAGGIAGSLTDDRWRIDRLDLNYGSRVNRYTVDQTAPLVDNHSGSSSDFFSGRRLTDIRSDNREYVYDNPPTWSPHLDEGFKSSRIRQNNDLSFSANLWTDYIEHELGIPPQNSSTGARQNRDISRYSQPVVITAPAVDTSKRGLDYPMPALNFRAFSDSASLGYSAWPGVNSDEWQTGSDMSFSVGPFGGGIGLVNSSPDGGMTYEEQSQNARDSIKGSNQSSGSRNFRTPDNGVPWYLYPFVNQQLSFGGGQFTSVMFDGDDYGLVVNLLDSAGISETENNVCRRRAVPVDPNFARKGNGSWGQPVDDQWAIKRVGYTDSENSAWNQVPDSASPVVVAVIDTGLDWHHLDISHENIWRNKNEIPDNGIDDDENGYVDDLIGWDFFARHNKPWDFDGHGTIVAGIIAATHNDVGIAGINPHAQVMVLKAINNFGNTRASYLAEAIVYAADNGARVINLSVGGPGISRMEQAAIDYAYSKGVLVVAASGNEGIELEEYGPGGRDNVLTVGATYFDDRAAAFSNFGESVDLVAPGVDVLSLRARYTDANFGAGEDYVVGDNFVGEDKRYIHVSGTSFSAPIVAATASLLMAKNPAFTAAEVQDLLQQTAEDIESPGKDSYSGYGLINATAALSVEPGFYVTAAITGVDPVDTEAGTVLHVMGTIDADGFKRGWMQIGAGENPSGWKYVGQKRKYPIQDGVLGVIPLTEFSGSELWQVVINVEHRNGVRKSTRYPVRIN